MKKITIYLLIIVFSIGNVSSQSYKDRIKNIKKNINKQYRKAEDKAKRIKNNYSKNYNYKNSRNYRNSNFDNLVSKYGSKVASSVKKVSDKYGSYVGNELAGCYNNYGKRVGDNIKNTLQKHGKEAGNNIMSAYKYHKPYIADEIYTVYNKYGKSIGNKVQITLNSCALRLEKYVRNSNSQKKAIKATVNAVILIDKIDYKKETYKALTYAVNNIRVKNSSRKTVTLNEYSKDWINQNAPYLKGTSISEDPVEAFTYVVIYQDMDYVVSDMRIVKNDRGQYCSIQDALILESVMDVNRTEELLDLVDSFETLTSNESSTYEVYEAANCIGTFKY